MKSDVKTINILVTRPEHQAEQLCRLIERQGWQAIRFPTLEIVAVENSAIIEQLENLGRYQWLIFISANAVNFALKANNGKIENFKEIPIAAVGKATEIALITAGLSVDLIPETHFSTEGLLATAEMNRVKGQDLLIIRGQGGREALANCLRERGAKVEYMEVYVREKPVYNDLAALDLIKCGKLQLITITSGDALKNLLAMINKKVHEDLFLVPLVVISNRIKKLANTLGFKHIAVTKKPSDDAIIEAMRTQLTNGEYSGQ